MTFFYTGAFMHHNVTTKVAADHPLHMFKERNRELDKIFHVYYEDGKRVLDTINYEPYLFVKNGNPNATPTSDFTNLKGEGLDKVMFDSYKDMKDVAVYNKNKGENQTYYGSTNPNFVYLNDTYRGEVSYDPSLITIANIDIEVAADEGFPNIEKAEKPITAITLKVRDKIYVFGCGHFMSDRSDVEYFKCTNEAALLNVFIEIWRKSEIDIVTGWNVEGFDIPYILYRILNVLTVEDAKKLSPFNKIAVRKVGTQSGEAVERPEILGISQLDYIALYRKFTYVQQESYSLDNISFVELGEKKLDYSEYDGLMSLYKNDYQKFIEYNIRDVELVDRLDQKLGLIDLVYAIAYDGKVNFADSLTSVRMWDMIIHNYLHDKKIAIDPFVWKQKERNVDGAYVKDPLTGMHKWIVSFDLNSLYPHLIMQYNIGPDTYVGNYPNVNPQDIIKGKLETPEVKQYMKEHNVTITGSGAIYTKDFRGFLPELMEKMYNDRVTYKDKLQEVRQQAENSEEDFSSELAKLDNMQMAKKIQLNSAYGALGNEFFRWFDIKYAESITLSGQLSIRWMESHINKYINTVLETENKDYVIACDTDSMYLTLDKLVEKVFEGKDPTTEDVIKWMDKVAVQLFEPFISQCYDKLAKLTNAYEQKMFMAREALADKGIWTAKKRYALHVHNMEGVQYAEPRLKISGLETQRSSVPAICRAKMKEAIVLIMEKDENALVDFVETFREEFKQLPFEDIAFPRGCRGLTKYGNSVTIYSKGTPIHVRGALVYNQLLKERDLDNTFNPVYEGDKVKFCYLKLPNPARENVIAAVSTLPKQMGCHPYIDYKLQFEKSFLEPLKTISEKIQWKLERGQATLEDFF
jgi:DNA polymerase elongation subunit (family B)